MDTAVCIVYVQKIVQRVKKKIRDINQIGQIRKETLSNLKRDEEKENYKKSQRDKKEKRNKTIVDKKGNTDRKIMKACKVDWKKQKRKLGCISVLFLNLGSVLEW